MPTDPVCKMFVEESPDTPGAAMAMSSVTVVTNSLTLRRFKPKF